MKSDRRRDLVEALAPLVRRLRRHRRRHDAIWITSAALTGASVGIVVARLASGDKAVFAIAGALLAASAVVAAAVAIHRRRRIDPLAAARRAERDPSLRERLSTALEHGEREGAVATALLADAVDHAARLAAAPIGPWRWPRGASAALVSSALLCTLLVAWPTAPLGATIGAATGAEASLAPSAGAIADLASDLAADARRSRDAYLAALAEQLRDLADEAGDAPLDAAGRARLDDLLEAIASVYGASIAADDLRAELAARDAELRSMAEAAADPDATSRPTATARPPAPNLPGSGPALDFNQMLATARETRYEDEPETFGAGDAGPAQDTTARSFDPASLEDGRDANLVEGAGPSGGAAEVIGAAEEAGAGDSLLAGRGSQALEGEAAAADFSDAEASAVTLTGSEREEGRRIDVELPPDVAWSDYDPAAFAVGAWRAGPESPVETDPTPLRYHAAAGRYFLPSQETAASR